MIQGTDKISEFPTQFNKLETEVRLLAANTRGIKIATWITAISTVALAVVGIFALMK